MKKTATTCVHPGMDLDKHGKSVTAVMAPSTAYDYRGEEELIYPGFFSTYNQKRLAHIVAELEGGAWGIAFSSGMSAITTSILSFVQEGDHVIFFHELYGGTWRLATEELIQRGVTCSFASNTLESFQRSVQTTTRVVYIETPSNPLLTLVDIEAIASWAKKKGIVTIIDNTFATPINQKPLCMGFDVVVHSGTKYLGGHNDLSFGIAVTSSLDYKQRILSLAKLYGGSLSPSCCYQAERSIKTLALRVERQNANALKIAQYLQECMQVKKVFYPGLPSHPDHGLAKKQMKGFGGMLSFELDEGKQEVADFLDRLRIIRPALSLGGVESLICSPAETSHSSLSPLQRQQMGIKDSLLRLSVGIEDVTDLIEDLHTAFIN